MNQFRWEVQNQKKKLDLIKKILYHTGDIVLYYTILIYTTVKNSVALKKIEHRYSAGTF